MTSPRKILHLDLDAFYCAVEEQRDPSLIGVPFAVGGRPEERGVVSSCSYAARRFGVSSAMPMWLAQKQCPGLRVISPNHSAYSRVSDKVMKLLRAVTPLVEQISIDEAFLDVSDIDGPPVEIARRIQASIHADLGLPCSLGVASNKLVAKTANDAGKARTFAARNEEAADDGSLIGPPNAITVVLPGEEADFMADLPVRALWGVGPKTAKRLADMGLGKIGELAKYSEKELVRLFSKTGYDLVRRAKGIDDRPIVVHHEPKSISREVTFARDENDRDKLYDVFHKMSGRISRSLQDSGYVAGTVKIKLRWPDFKTLTRQVTLTKATDHDETIHQAAVSLFEKEWQAGMKVRLIGVGVSGLRRPIRQLSFWEDLQAVLEQDADGDQRKRQMEQLQAALEQLRQRYGEEIIHMASDLKPGQEWQE